MSHISNNERCTKIGQTIVVYLHMPTGKGLKNENTCIYIMDFLC